MILTIIDDSGILGLLDCAAYSSFVREDWEYPQMLRHFRDQADRKTMLVWDAGDGGNQYRIAIRQGLSGIAGHRAATGSVRVTQGALHIASYTALTMAAQYANQPLPASHEKEAVIEIGNGDYVVRVVQMYDPDSIADWDEESPHFLIEMAPGNMDTSQNVAWFLD